MRIVRRVALLGSVLLIIAGAVALAVQRAGSARDRDLRVQEASFEGASALAQLVVTVQTAATTARDVDALDPVLTALPAGARWCASPAETATVTCGGDLAGPAAAALEAAVGTGDGSASVVDAHVVTVVAGDRVVLGIAAGAEALAEVTGTDASLTIADAAGATLPPHDRGGARVAGAMVAGTDAVVLATVDGSIPLTGGSTLFLVLVLALAVALLALAAATLRAEQRVLEHRASIDPLTQLPNRSEFERRADEQLEEARRTGTGACMLLFDLDGFKLINDTYGHQAGDEVLRTIGQRLRHAVRDYDVVARWGGDEFVLLLPGIEDASAARSRAGDLARLVAGEVIGDGMHVGASVGIAMFPRHGGDLASLIQAADGAMYAAKRDGVTSRLAGVESAPLGQPSTLVERRQSQVPAG